MRLAKIIGMMVLLFLLPIAIMPYSATSQSTPIPCSPCFTNFAYIAYHDGSLVIKNGPKTIKLLSVETKPNANLLVSPQLNTQINPGTLITISILEPLSDYYEIKIKFVDLSTGFNYTDSAVLYTRGAPEKEGGVNKPSVINYTIVITVATIFSLVLILVIIFLAKGSKNKRAF
jgi:hypothetical protein